MSPLAMVLVLLAAAVVMFAFNRPRMDVVAVLMMVLLPLTGVITITDPPVPAAGIPGRIASLVAGSITTSSMSAVVGGDPPC